MSLSTTPASFYERPPSVPAAPGRLVSAEDFSASWLPRSSKAWRILYTTTLDQGEPALASAVVIVPRVAAGPLDTITWAHGSTGVSRDSAPSLSKRGLESGALFVLEEVIAAGWGLIATDYVGLGTAGSHPWLVGEPSGRAVLDSARAAAQLPGITLRQTIIWGHSQGGHAALWAGGLADQYSPEVPLRGVAALAPAADVPGVLAHLDDVPFGSVFVAYAVQSYGAAYPEVSVGEYIRPTVRRFLRQLAKRPLHHPLTLIGALAATALRMKTWRQDPSSGHLGSRLSENTPTAAIAVPLLIAHGTHDEVIPTAGQDAYVAERIRAGQQLQYRRYEGLKHLTLVKPGSPAVEELMQWTREKFVPRNQSAQ